jgi:hypothetical protein
VTRPKKGGGGRHTPKQNTGSDSFGIPAWMDSDPNLSDPAAEPRLPHLDPDAFERAILESTVDINELDPEDLDLDALGLGDVDPIEIIVARMTQALEEGTGPFLEEASSAAWMLHDTVEPADRAASVEMFAGFESTGDALMSAMASLGMTDDVRRTAEATAALKRAGVPAWLRDLSRAEVTGWAIGRYEPDDEVEVIAEVSIPSANPFLVVINRSKVVHELIVQVSTLLEPLDHLMADVNGDDLIQLRIDPTTAQGLADELALSLQPTIEWAENSDVGGLPLDSGVEMLLPLARWVATMLPPPTVEPFYGFEGEQRDAGLEIYRSESSPEPSEIDLQLVGQALDYSVERDPFRWTPQRLVNMFERLSNVIDDPAPFVDALRRFLPFAAARHANGAELLNHNLTVLDSVEQHADELFGT